MKEWTFISMSFGLIYPLKKKKKKNWNLKQKNREKKFEIKKKIE